MEGFSVETILNRMGLEMLTDLNDGRLEEVDQWETWVEGFTVETAVNRMGLKMPTDFNDGRLKEFHGGRGG